MRIPYAELVLSAKIGAGAQGAIYRAQPNPSFGLSFPLIYKEFSAKTVVAGLSLEHLAAFRSQLDERDRAVIDERTVWPAAVVEKAGRVCGYVMQEIPAPFMQTILTTSGSEPIPREVQHLFVADDLARKNIGEIPKRTERLALARETAFIFGFLHKRELIFGDFSYKNAVYTLRPRPMVMLLDCDAVRRRGQGSAVPQLNSPGWGAPEKGPQTIESDRYKLGLFVLRCLTPGVNAQNRDPEKAAKVLDAEGLGLLRRALGADPEARPSGKQWVEYLDARIASSGGVRVRTAPAAAPAPPPKVARRASSSVGRRLRAQPLGPARTSAAGRAPRPAASGVGGTSPVWPPKAAKQWPPVPGAFGSPPTRARAMPVLYNRNGPLGMPQLSGAGFLLLLLVIAAGFVVVSLASSFGNPRAPRTAGTLATLPTTVTFARTPTTGAPWPTGARAVAQSPVGAVAAAMTTAGKGWDLVGLYSTAVVPAGAADGTARPSWFVELRGPAHEGSPSTAPWRTYEVDASSNVTLLSERDSPAEGPGAVPAMGSLWPVALERALDLVLTPTRQQGPILVRYECTSVAEPECAWELRFLKSATQPAEFDRVYVTADGQKTMPVPPWATPR